MKREERVKPSPLAEAKKVEWPMAMLLHRGPENGGIGADDFEAALEIVAAFHAITKGLGYKPLDLERVGRGALGMSDGDARIGAIFLDWAAAFERRTKVRAGNLAQWIEDARAFHPDIVPVLRVAGDLWRKARDDHDRAARAEREGRGSIHDPD